ncbi:hypothetical protein [Urechidicola vernalis]|uniref:Uncharacterized protein n=1 Tax=Urechidicola vernalis TaxID=3075600 RepID=A0ABU2Y0V9_9FLAO|nr:hypothetical protein [Urechidicola sp. P050]MDT0551808.1 hypothetical protein [Urechidicola sp. P050]
MKTKKISSVVLIACLISLYGFAQESNTDYQMASIVFIDAKIGHEKDFESKVIEHNNKFHNEAPNKGYLDQVISGKNAGTYVWVMGPCTFTDLENMNPGDGHEEHWDTEVVPLIKGYGAQEYWRFNEKLSYYPNPVVNRKFANLWLIDLKRGDYYRFKTLMGKIAEAYEKKGTGNMRVYDNQFNADDGRDVVIIWDMENMAELDIMDPIKPAYEEVNGEGSWDTMLEEWEEITLKIDSQLWRVNITK